MSRRAAVFDIMVLMTIEVHKALVDRGAAEALSHAIGDFSDNPASSFISSDERHISVIEGKVVVW